MDCDEEHLIPRPLRPSPKSRNRPQNCFFPDGDSSEGTVTPPTTSSSSSSFNKTKSPKSPVLIDDVPPIPPKNPLRKLYTQLPSANSASPGHRSVAAHSLNNQPPLLNINHPPPRHPSRLTYRDDANAAPNPPRWSSLETIESVRAHLALAEVQGEGGRGSIGSIESAPIGGLALGDDDSSPDYQDAPSLARSSDSSSAQETSLQEPLLLPEYLEFSAETASNRHFEDPRPVPSLRRYSLRRTSERSSQSSSDRGAQQRTLINHDINALSESELMERENRGMNPTLYLR
jgi:hypothetical protein